MDIRIQSDLLADLDLGQAGKMTFHDNVPVGT